MLLYTKLKSFSGIVTALFKLKLSNPSLIGLQYLIVGINTSLKCQLKLFNWNIQMTV